jgi:hypothetical protein
MFSIICHHGLARAISRCEQITISLPNFSDPVIPEACSSSQNVVICLVSRANTVQYSTLTFAACCTNITIGEEIGHCLAEAFVI